MAITFESKKYHVAIDSNTIIGVLGNDYSDFLKSLVGDDIYYYNGLHSTFDVDFYDEDLLEYRELLNLDEFISKKTSDLSHSEIRLLGYYLMVNSKAKIMVVDDPYLYLDNSEIKKVNLLFNKLVKDGKTIITGSFNINDIYSLCKKVLILNDSDVFYDNIKCLNNKKVLDKYGLDMPNIVEFVELAKAKNIKIPYSKDIRDLIKDVYRNVSKK